MLRALTRPAPLVLLLLLSCTLLLQSQIQQIPTHQNDTVLHLPLDSQHIWVSNSGYARVASDLMWMETIAYFGGHLKGDQRFDYLIAMLNAITRINPHHEAAYRMAASVLPWVLHAQPAAERLLLRALVNNPHQGIWAYYLGVNRYLFRDDAKTAAHFLQMALQRGFISRQALSLNAKLMARADSLLLSQLHLQQMLANTGNPDMRHWIEQEITAIATERELRRIARMFPAGSTPNERRHLLRRWHAAHRITLPLPDGGSVIVDNDGAIHSSRTPKRFQLYISPNLKAMRR